MLNVVKDTNPKDAVGTAKVPISTVPTPVLAEVGLAMMEGARKYGRHNFRAAGVRASVYYDAVFRHLASFWEGEDIDPDSGLPHVVKAIACLAVLRDSQIQGNWTDDRPPRSPDNWQADLNEKAAALLEKYPDPLPAHTEKVDAPAEPPKYLLTINNATDSSPGKVAVVTEILIRDYAPEPRQTDVLTKDHRDGKFRDDEGRVLHFNEELGAWYDNNGKHRGQMPFVAAPFVEVFDEPTVERLEDADTAYAWEDRKRVLRFRFHEGEWQYSATQNPLKLGWAGVAGTWHGPFTRSQRVEETH